jgi:hypothetical protein
MKFSALRGRLDHLTGWWNVGRVLDAVEAMGELDATLVVSTWGYSNLFKLEHTKPGFVAELLAALTVRYPTVPISFCETRPLAEEWTYRFLGAALAYAQAETDAPTRA